MVQGDFIYNFTFSGLWKRMTVFSRLYDEAEGWDRFSVEVAVPETAPVDRDALRKDFEDHVRKHAICQNLELVGTYVTHRAYPVFRRGQAPGVAQDRALIESLGICIAGRQGKFAYLSSAEATLQARHVAERVLRDQPARRTV